MSNEKQLEEIEKKLDVLHNYMINFGQFGVILKNALDSVDEKFVYLIKMFEPDPANEAVSNMFREIDRKMKLGVVDEIEKEEEELKKDLGWDISE